MRSLGGREILGGLPAQQLRERRLQRRAGACHRRPQFVLQVPEQTGNDPAARDAISARIQSLVKDAAKTMLGVAVRCEIQFTNEW